MADLLPDFSGYLHKMQRLSGRFGRTTALAVVLMGLANAAHAQVVVDYSQLPATPAPAPAPQLTPEGYRQITRLHSALARENAQPTTRPVAVKLPVVLRPLRQKIALVPPLPVLPPMPSVTAPSSAVSATLAAANHPALPQTKIAVPIGHSPPNDRGKIQLKPPPEMMEGQAPAPQTVIKPPRPIVMAELSVWHPGPAPLPITLIQWPHSNLARMIPDTNLPPIVPASPAETLIEPKIIPAGRRRGLSQNKTPDTLPAEWILPTVSDRDHTPIAPPQTKIFSPVIGLEKPTMPAPSSTDISSAATGQEIAPLPQTLIRPVASDHLHAKHITPAPVQRITAAAETKETNSISLPDSAAEMVSPPRTAIIPVRAASAAIPAEDTLMPVIAAEEPTLSVPAPQTHIAKIVAVSASVNKPITSFPIAQKPQMIANDAVVPLPKTQIAAANLKPAVIATAPSLPASSVKIVESDDVLAPPPQTMIVQTAPTKPIIAAKAPAMIAALPNKPVSSAAANIMVPVPKTVIRAKAKPEDAALTQSGSAAAVNETLPVSPIAEFTKVVQMAVADDPAPLPKTVIGTAENLPKSGRSTPITHVQKEAPVSSAPLPHVHAPQTNIIAKLPPMPPAVAKSTAQSEATSSAANDDIALPKTVIASTVIAPKIHAKPITQIFQEQAPIPAPAIENKTDQNIFEPATNAKQDTANEPVPEPTTAITMAALPSVKKPAAPAEIPPQPAAEIVQNEPASPVTQPAPVAAEISPPATIAKIEPSVETEIPPASDAQNVAAPKAVTQLKPIKAKIAIKPPATVVTPAEIAAVPTPSTPSLADIERQIAKTEASIAQLNDRLNADSPKTSILKPVHKTVKPPVQRVTAPPVAPIKEAAKPAQTTLAQVAPKLESVAPIKSSKQTDLKPAENTAPKNYTVLMAQLEATESALAALKADNQKLTQRMGAQELDQTAANAEKEALLKRLNETETNLNLLEQQNTQLNTKTQTNLPLDSQKSLAAALSQRLSQSERELAAIKPPVISVPGKIEPSEIPAVQLPKLVEAPPPSITQSNKNIPGTTRQLLTFNQNIAAIDPSHNLILDNFANQLRSNPALKLTIRTYGGVTSAPSDARRVALARAAQLRDAFKSRGIPQEQMSIQAIGVPAQLQLNDRAELAIQ